MKRWPAFLLASSLWLTAAVADAHPLSPASLLLEERAEAHVYAASFRRPSTGGDVLRLALPAFCTATPSVERIDAQGFLVGQFVLRCPRSLAGAELAIEGLTASGTGALLHIQFAHGRVVRALLTPETPRYRVPVESSRAQVFRDYLTLGVEHLLTGLDHVLFVLGLCLLVPGVRRIALALTAFTLGHSLTLCASALGVVSLPSAEVEVGIALSIAWLALEVVSLRGRMHPRTPLLMAGGFGLLHGLGFAGALAETGLPGHAIPLALFSFNVGVEVGQLCVVLGCAPLLFAYQQLRPAHGARARSVLGYALGSLAAMWCIERSVALF